MFRKVNTDRIFLFQSVFLWGNQGLQGLSKSLGTFIREHLILTVEKESLCKLELKKKIIGYSPVAES